MRVGVSLTSSHTTRDVRAAARWMIERAATARESGLDSLFIGDHHAMPVPYYQNTPMLGRLLAEWGDKPAGCLFLLPLWNPVLLAEQVGTLAAIHPGRFIIQCALGAGRAQFDGMGANQKTRPSAFEEGLDIIRRLLAGERVSGSLRYPAIREATIAPLPPEPVDVWIGGSVEASIDRAARLGDAWLAGPEFTRDEARRWVAFYSDRCVAYGRKPSAVAIRRDIYVGESDEQAASVAMPIIEAGYRGFQPEALTFGSPATVAAVFRDYAAMGFTDVIIRHLTNSQSQVLGSMRRLKEVRQAVAAD
jgi:alkanesulfonate monooxygenase SsuD/methylene tetrahydromethanopterin reductase-like flavin-dependent oxidoreductase (luciferase family)